MWSATRWDAMATANDRASATGRTVTDSSSGSALAGTAKDRCTRSANQSDRRWCRYDARVRKPLTVDLLCRSAAEFSAPGVRHEESDLFGVTDGKAVGTYLEMAFKKHLARRCTFDEGSAAKGIDFPEIKVDLKSTSLRQPQSSCPFKSARQKVYGLGYSLLVLVYRKIDDHRKRTGRLEIQHAIFVSAEQTADFQTTRGLRQIIDNHGNVDDVVAFFQDRMLPADEVEGRRLAEEVLRSPPPQGFLTISNALQWRLQYSRVIERAGMVTGVRRVR